MSAARGRFADLAPRLASAAVLAGLAGGAVWFGGVWLLVLVFVLVAAMVWELARMIAPEWGATGALSAASLAGALVVAVSLGLSPVRAGLVLLVPPVAAAVVLPRLRLAGAGYLALILLAGHAFLLLRGEFGLVWTLWLVLLVIGSDASGYFAGRLIGGPKFWPAVSPKKTWSGTVAGWLAGAAIGAAMAGWMGAGPWLVALSVLVVFAGQLGDIAESALKRRVGVKDASNLIPGHGGFMDRFDAMAGAALAFLLLVRAGLLAPGA